MAEPVIIDDGGSTRIKQIQAGVNMDKLLNNIAVDTADGAFSAGGAANTCRLKVFFRSKDGANHIGMPGRPDFDDFGVTDRVEIISENRQKVTITIDATGLVKIALASLVAGVNPLVQALSHANQRRYVVTNAGPVDTVKIFDTSVVPAVLKVTPFDNGALADKSIHTIVHLSG